MFDDHNSTIYDILVASPDIPKEQVDVLYSNDCRENTKPFADEVLGSGLISKGQLFRLIGNYLGFDAIEDEIPQLEPSVVAMLQPDVARNYAVIPLQLGENEIHLLAKDPFNFSIIDDLTFSLKMDVSLVVCDPEVVDDGWLLRKPQSRCSSRFIPVATG